MSKAKEIMHPGAECVATSDTLETAARMMRDRHVGALPICGRDYRLQGIITDRDIVVKCLAEGRDPKTTTAGDLARGKPVWVDANAEDGDVLRLMEEHHIRRLPVIEEQRARRHDQRSGPGNAPAGGEDRRVHQADLLGTAEPVAADLAARAVPPLPARARRDRRRQHHAA